MINLTGTRTLSQIFDSNTAETYLIPRSSLRENFDLYSGSRLLDKLMVTKPAKHCRTIVCTKVAPESQELSTLKVAGNSHVLVPATLMLALVYKVLQERSAENTQAAAWLVRLERWRSRQSDQGRSAEPPHETFVSLDELLVQDFDLNSGLPTAGTPAFDSSPLRRTLKLWIPQVQELPLESDDGRSLLGLLDRLVQVRFVQIVFDSYADAAALLDSNPWMFGSRDVLPMVRERIRIEMLLRPDVTEAERAPSVREVVASVVRMITRGRRQVHRWSIPQSSELAW